MNIVKVVTAGVQGKLPLMTYILTCIHTKFTFSGRKIVVVVMVLWI